MADYFQIKNQSILNPPANTNLGNSTNQYSNVYVQSNLILSNTTFTSSTLGAPKISSIGYPGDDTAANPAGGQTITLTGSGFNNGASVIINNSAVGVVTVVNSTTITFVSPALSVGSYTIYVVNTDGSTAIAIPGIQYSGTPNWTTAAGTLGSLYETQSFSNTVIATGDAPISYSLFSGTLPTGATLNNNGTITGTSVSTASSTTYTFTIRATDNEQQDTDRQFSLTINPDVVTWSSPANASVINSYEYVAISNTTLSATNLVGGNISYSGANLPAGITVTGNLLAGTSNTIANTTVTLTATSNTSTRSTDRTTFINVQQDVVTWNSPANNNTYTSDVNSAISNVTLNATSAAGFSVSYSANTLPTGLTITGNVIAGTPTVAANSSSLITATAATTNRSATRTFNWVIQVGNDSYFNLTTLLLNGETSSNYWIQDASTNKFAVTVVGDTRPMAFSPYETVWSNYFDGTGDGLSIAANSAFALGTSDFTIEFWVYAPSQTNTFIMDIRGGTDAGYPIITFGSSTAVLRWGPTNTQGTILIGDNKWHHCAITRQSNTLRLFVDGTLDGSTTDSGNYSTQYGLSFGYNSYGGNNFTGYLSNFRLIKGTALYTSSFTPPTSPLTAITNTSVLICQSNRLIDNSTNNFTITRFGDVLVSNFGPFTETDLTTGSGYFDGTGDYLQAPSNAAFSPSTGDFTIECWAYLTAVTGEGTLFYVNATNGINLFLSISSNWGIARAGVAVDNNFGTPPTLNVWNHLAVSRFGSTIRAFINGTQVFSGTNSSNYAQGSALVGSSNGFGTITGYVSNFRFVKGTAVYTVNFTPPTSPLTAIANTSLLTLQNRFGENNNRFVDTSGIGNFITRNGNTTQGALSPFSQTGWSNYFDGNGDYLTAPSNAAFSFGTGDFTVECWIYRNPNSPANQGIFTNGPTSAGSFGCYVNANVLRCDFYTGTALAGTTTIPVGTWNHVAITRSSSTLSLYLNGMRDATTTSTFNNTTSECAIGRSWTNYASDEMGGYISNFRLLKGTALYTGATYTVPTAPLSVIANTSLLTCQSNRFIDNSTNNFTITRNGDASVQTFSPFVPAIITPTSYSGYFDGTGDYLSNSTNNTPLALGSGDFTIEFWLNPTNTGGTSVVYDNRINTSSATGGFNIYYTGGALYVFGGSSTDIQLVASNNWNYNVWTHFAIVRNGSSSGNVKLYVNGSLESTYGSADTNNYSQGYLNIGAYLLSGTPSLFVNGYISNFRIVKGTAVYTANFTPPTSPLTAISGTSLLTCQSNQFIDNSTNNFTITVNGNSIPRQFNPFGNTSLTSSSAAYSIANVGGSMYFDGNADFLKIDSTSMLTWSGTTTFTVEGWFYQTTFDSTSGFMNNVLGDLTPNSSFGDALYWSIGMNNSNQPGVRWFGGPTVCNATTALQLNTWNHVAWVVTSGVLKIYINGVSATLSGTSTLTSAAASLNYVVIGADRGKYFTGYMANLRVLRIALYTSNFTPPVAPLTTISNTTLLLNGTNSGLVDYTSKNILETVGNAQLSTTVTKFGNASMSFDGSGDYLIIAAAEGNRINTTGNFTIEFWAYFNSVASDQRLIGWDNATNNFVIAIYTGSTGVLNYYLSSSGTSWNIAQQISMGNIATNTWYHVALVRNGSVFTPYLNGVAGTTTTSSATLTTSTLPFSIGAVSNGTSPFNGYIDDFRITKGYARYTANFTPPTTAFLTY
jgi:hypothetical protein